jgi:hypothetical protein
MNNLNFLNYFSILSFLFLRSSCSTKHLYFKGRGPFLDVIHIYMCSYLLGEDKIDHLKKKLNKVLMMKIFFSYKHSLHALHLHGRFFETF